MTVSDTPEVRRAESRDGRIEALELEVAQLKVGLRNRELISEAKGILMAQSRYTEDEAFECLIGASQRCNRKLSLICRDLVDAVAARNAKDRVG